MFVDAKTSTLALDLMSHYAAPDGQYRVVRYYSNGVSRTIKRGLTLDEAMAHCSDLATSSNSWRGLFGRFRKRLLWFDGFVDETSSDYVVWRKPSS